MGRDLNPGPSEYKVELISQVIKSINQSINQSQCLIALFLFLKPD